MSRGDAKGCLLVVGGAERRGEGGEAILRRFVDLAGGRAARLVVIATASEQPERLEDAYVRALAGLGAGEVRPLRLENRVQANGDEAASAVNRATGVFFTGGDQLRIATVLGGTRVDALLHHRLRRDDLVLAGTSAGAAMMSSTMVLGGDEHSVSTTSVRTGPGMEFLPGVLIDMHFWERGRLDRLLSAVALFPHQLGLGIDEDTAILVRDDHFEVLGSGSVTVVDAGPSEVIRVPDDDVDPAGLIALTDVRLHVLPSGYTFELTGRRPVVVSAAGGTEEREEQT
ncbi:cyanophycinase [Rhizomonospora bruguierae]|uniref:cyanophycinase n=1 Tax=Rhizomonospora bruguierae TaxID=1581705 RepID=UPI001BD12BD6|nr:cyanophycinase [Micromonospora sp. NBRC 107566]